MTSEKAIDILDDNFTVIDTHGHFSDEEVEEARQMAIKALENQCPSKGVDCEDCPANEPCEDWHDVPSDKMTLGQARQAVKDLRRFVMDNHILPIQPCEDLIDRAEAMTEIMMFAGNVKSDEEDVCIKVSDAVQLLRELPPVTPTRKKGHWIEERNDYGEVTGWHCDKCYEDSGFTTTCKWDFCPNCGSDNREVEK